MAEIKMDVSEYEEMKKNAKLLEQALEREQKNAETIAALKQEKIDVLEKAKHKVLKTVRKDTYETVLVQRPALDAVKRLIATVGQDRYQPGRFIGSMHMDYYDSEVQRIVDCFFDRTTAISMGEEEVLEEIGIEQFKKELRKDMRDELDKNTAKKVEEHPALIKEIENYRKEVKSIDKMLTAQIKLREKADKQVEEYKQSIDANKLLVDGYRDLKFYAKMKAGLFRASDYKRKLLDVIDRVEMELKYIDKK